MLRFFTIGLSMILVCAPDAAESTPFDWGKYQPSEWEKYQALNATQEADSGTFADVQPDTDVQVTFHDLKSESDRSLSRRLLGAAGQRIAYIDRHKDRWYLYHDGNDPAESIDLYTHPYALGWSYGLCGVERYSLRLGAILAALDRRHSRLRFRKLAAPKSLLTIIPKLFCGAEIGPLACLRPVSGKAQTRGCRYEARVSPDGCEFGPE